MVPKDTVFGAPADVSYYHFFADDCLLYRGINGVNDTNRLQEDLNRLFELENTWQLKCNVSKCSVIYTAQYSHHHLSMTTHLTIVL